MDEARAVSALAYWSGPLFAAALVFGPTVVYLSFRRRGTSARVAAAAAFLVPVAWLAKECIAVGRLFGPLPGLYYAVNPLALGLLTAAALQMAAVELLVHRLRHGKWRLASGAGAVVGGVAAAAIVFAVVTARSDVTVVFWLYISGYRWLFGDGQ